MDVGDGLVFHGDQVYPAAGVAPMSFTLVARAGDYGGLEEAVWRLRHALDQARVRVLDPGRRALAFAHTFWGGTFPIASHPGGSLTRTLSFVAGKPALTLDIPAPAPLVEVAAFEADTPAWPVYHDWCLDHDWPERAKVLADCLRLLAAVRRGEADRWLLE